MMEAVYQNAALVLAYIYRTYYRDVCSNAVKPTNWQQPMSRQWIDTSIEVLQATKDVDTFYVYMYGA